MNSEEIHLRDYLRVINKHRGKIFTFMLVVLAIVALRVFSATPQYLGSSKVMIEKAESNNLTDRYSYNYYDPEFYETQFQLIKSKQVGRRVVDLLSLERTIDSYLGEVKKPSTLQSFKHSLVQFKNNFFAPNQPDLEDNTSDADTVGQQSRADNIANMISAGIRVSPVKESRIVSISYSSPQPEFAALIANTVAKAYMETTLEMKMEATRRTLEWMTKKTDQERQKLEKTEQELQRYMRANDLVTLENRIAVTPQKLSQISTELVKAQNNREKLQGLYEKIKRVSDQPGAAESLLGITNGKTLQTLRDQILKAEQYIRELSTKFGPKHPTMIKAAGDLEILENKKKQEIRRLIESVKNEYEIALADENNLLRKMKETKAEAHSLNEKFIQYGAYHREMETNRQLYDALLLKMKEENITGEIQPINLWVVEQAQVPQSPYKPNKKKNLLLGLIVGLFGGIGLAFFIEYLDQSVKYPEETEQALGFPVLGLIPVYKEKKGTIDKVMVDQPRSVIAENYRALRTSIMLSTASQPPKTILVTSPGPSAGKSTTAVNLAVAIANSGKKVLLIDGDLRKPRLQKILGVNGSQGLSSYLTGLSRSGLVLQTPVQNLALLPAGPIPPNPSELLLAPGLKIFITQLSEKFDFVIFDSPPLQSVVDARILSQVVDGTVVVLRAKQTTYEIARNALKQLQDANAPVLGLLINALDLKKSDHYYQYYSESYGDEPLKYGFDGPGKS